MAHGERSTTVNVLLSTINTAVYALLILSGLYLLTSLLRIHAFLKDNNATAEIDIKTMLIHGGAFGLFMVSTAVLLIASVAASFWPSNNTIIQLWLLSLDFYAITDFVSQLLLMVIFWRLGEKEEPVSDDDEPEVRMTGFDEEAQLQA